MLTEGAYSDLCADGDDEESVGYCARQLLQLYLMFTVATSATNLTSLPVGWMMDKIGSRASHLLGCAAAAVGCLLFAFGAYIVGFVIIGVSGMMIFLSQFYLSRHTFDQWRGLIYAVITGCFNASTSTFLILEPLSNAGFQLKAIFLGFSCAALVFGILSYFTYPEDRRTPQKADIQFSSVESKLSSSETLSSSSFSLAHSASSSSPFSHLTAIQQITTVEAILLDIYLSWSSLFLVYYFSTIGNQLAAISDNTSKVDLYTNIFFYFVPIGAILGIPLTGHFLDRIGVTTSFIVTRVIFLVVEIILLIPNLEVQLIGFAIIPFGNIFLWTSVPEAITRLFGTEHFGVVYGTCMTGPGVVSFLSYAFVFFSLLLESWVYVNVFLLVTEALLIGIPIWLWWKHFRRENQFVLVE